MPIYAECFECGEDIEIAIWDDAILSDLLKPVCMDCEDDVPEFSLWETPDPDDDHFDFIVDEMPTTLDDDEDWVVRDHYEGWEDEFVDENGELPDWIRDPPTMGETFDIIVRDADDEDAVTAARAEVEQRRRA